MSEVRQRRADIVVTGVGACCAEPGERLDVVRFLKERKSKKYLGRQDELAVVATGAAVASAGIDGALGERTGLYLAVGYIPFQLRDIEPVLARSLDDDGAFCIERFTSDAYHRAHPLLAFRCLPNMPAFHIAANFGVEGPYQVAYPSAGQLYVVLEQAAEALSEGLVDRALVTGVAHQRNFLVAHHHRRIGVDPDTLVDAAATIVLERSSERGGMATLADLDVGYAAFDPLAENRAEDNRSGPAGPLLALRDFLNDEASPPHTETAHQGRDGIVARARWTR